MDLQSNPFSALSFIAAPAVLTNCSAVLILSTSNRLARAVDLARSVMNDMEHADPGANPNAEVQSRELMAAQRRMLILLSALRSFYVALGGFGIATLTSIIGASVAQLASALPAGALEFIAILAGAAAVASLVRGSVLLLRETRIAVRIIEERMERMQAKFNKGQSFTAGEMFW